MGGALLPGPIMERCRLACASSQGLSQNLAAPLPNVLP